LEQVTQSLEIRWRHDGETQAHAHGRIGRGNLGMSLNSEVAGGDSHSHQSRFGQRTEGFDVNAGSGNVAHLGPKWVFESCKDFCASVARMTGETAAILRRGLQ